MHRQFLTSFASVIEILSHMWLQATLNPDSLEILSAFLSTMMRSYQLQHSLMFKSWDSRSCGSPALFAAYICHAWLSAKTPVDDVTAGAGGGVCM